MKGFRISGFRFEVWVKKSRLKGWAHKAYVVQEFKKRSSVVKALSWPLEIKWVGDCLGLVRGCLQLV